MSTCTLNSSILHKKILEITCQVESRSIYSRDNLLCFSVSLQPHFLVWAASLLLHTKVGQLVKEIALENAQEEFFGLLEEGSHAPLSLAFFKQIGNFEGKHYSKAEKEIGEIYQNLKNMVVILTLITCMEIWSSIAMDKILIYMKEYGAENFEYINIHKVADFSDEGHGMKFLAALEAENPSEADIKKGLDLFGKLFTKIFV